MTETILIEKAKVRQALEALQAVYLGERDTAHYAAIDDLRAAIEQAEKQRFELIGHADLGINNIYIFNGYGEEVPEGRTPLYAGYTTQPAAPVQEPCQYAVDVAMPEHRCVGKCQYAAQRQWVGLTEQEKHGIYRRAGLSAYHLPDSVVQYQYDRCLDDYVSAIEAKLREKNS